MTEKIKIVLKISLTAIFFALCAFLPSRFAPPPVEISEPSPSPTESVYRPLASFSDRAALFNEIFDFSEGSIDGVSFDSSELDEAALRAVQEHITYILKECTVDMGRTAETGPYGVDFIEVYGADGSYLRLVQYYDGWNGDWQNWIRIIMDVDTLDLYFLYMSSECLQNHDKYNTLPSHDSLTRFLGAYTGYGKISETEVRAGEKAKIIYTYASSVSSSQMTYDITGGTSYIGGEPYLVDYVIQCLPDTMVKVAIENTDAKS